MLSPRKSPGKFEKSSISWKVLVFVSVFLVILLILVLRNSEPSFLSSPCAEFKVVNRSQVNNSLCTNALLLTYAAESQAYATSNPNYLKDLYLQAKIGSTTYYFPTDDTDAFSIADSKAFGSTSLPINGTLTNYFTSFPASGGAAILVEAKYKKNAIGTYSIV